MSFTLHFPTKYKSPAMPTFAITQTKFNTNYNGSHTATAIATAAAATATVIPCKWYPYGHRLVNGINCDLLPFLRKHFANETDTSSVSARLESARNAAPGSRQPTGKLAVRRRTHLPHSKTTYGGHKNVKRTTFATLAPFGQPEMEHARGNMPEVYTKRCPAKLDARYKHVAQDIDRQKMQLQFISGNWPIII